MAIYPLEGVTIHWSEELNLVTAHDVNKRLRLGTKSQDEDAKTKEDFQQVATNVLSLLGTSERSWISKLLK